MKLEVKIQLLRFCSTVLNSIFMALGVSVAGCAVWILFDKGSFLSVISSVEMKTVGAGLLMIGGVVTMVSVLGCLGAQSENRFLLLMYMGLLIVLVLGQLFITLLLIINREKVEQSLDDAVHRIIVGYGGGGREDRLIDNVQHQGSCCGRTGQADWLNNSVIESLNLTDPDVLPCSCFKHNQPIFNSSWCSENITELQYGRGNMSYHEGCKEKLSDWLQENTLTIISMDVSLVLLQVLQLVLAVYLHRSFGQKASLKRTNRLVDPEPAQEAAGPPDGEQNYAYIDPEYDHMDPNHPARYHDDLHHGVPPPHGLSP
ncbi:CD82 antigen [Scomber scombrus]|uniref:CD82 antigen n=1 Tax=Scomber scombrus TaxID=13677 RepID=UPI002DDC259A|nr:CD82 antigen [Scomber scombrus]